MVLQAVDKGLGMLNPDAQGKGLRFNPNLPVYQQPENIARRMTRGQENGFGLQPLSPIQDHPLSGPALDHHVIHARFKPYLTAGAHNRFTKGRHERRQPVGADMGMGLKEYVFMGPVGHQYFKYPAHIAPLDRAGVQLSVGVGACTAFAKAIIGFGIDLMLFVDGRNVAPAHPHIFSSFQDYRFDAGFEQPNGRKESGRAGTNHCNRPGIVGCRE
jgi:hypothetical protein